MTVWTVQRHVDYEGFDIIAICTSEEKALEMLEIYKEKGVYSADYYNIEKHETDIMLMPIEGGV